jgi:2-polyprenyl-3-methyl-5-hydroxy-6-metoxy-1,4-benzoquinol methylase
MSEKPKESNSVNHNINLLCEFNLSNKNSFEIFNASTRDINNLNVLKCINSGVIVLEKFILSEDYYEKNINYTDGFEGNIETKKGVIESKPLEDDIRRFESYKELIKGSEILDFGCGRGGFIKLSKKISKRSVGLELNKVNKDYLNNIGVQCVNTLAELNDDKFDLITLNHVFEHLNDPINILVELQKYLKDDGIIIIEVPHARDLLLETFNLESFKNFTFWSEHLILHTRKSLEIFTTKSGLKLKKIEGFQRYPISNHFNWLFKGEPSGHEIFHNLNHDDFHKHYEKLLDSIDQTDTLIGYFSKNI